MLENVAGDAVAVSLLNDREAARVLRVKPCTVRNERLRGKLGYIRVGGRIFYTREQITEYLDQQRVAACVDISKIQDQGRSVPTGPAGSRAGTARPIRGAEPGTIAEDDRRAESDLARQIFNRRDSCFHTGAEQYRTDCARQGITST